MQLIIKNKAEVDAFLFSHAVTTPGLVAVKGSAPKGATYSDGELITQPVNVAWECLQSGERVAIRYVHERPILLSGNMVRATLAGIKHVTRRPVDRLAGKGRVTQFGRSDTPGYDWTFRDRRGWNDFREDRLWRGCPWGTVGDRLWVRETWGHTGTGVWNIRDVATATDGQLVYRATEDVDGEDWRWWPCIHMPRWACRLVLGITSLSLERIRDISEAEAVAEGVACVYPSLPPRYAMQLVWDALYAARGLGWNANPWVWRIGYELVEVK